MSKLTAGRFVALLFLSSSLFLVSLSLAPPASAAEGIVRLGVELQVNTYTSSNAKIPVVTLDAARNFVVVWQSPEDGSDYGIFARRFASSGAALTPQFQVNAYTTGRQYEAAIASESDGDFVVAWYGDTDGGGYGVFARRFNSTGAAQGTAFQVNTYTTGQQIRPAVAVASSGTFVIVWESNGQDGFFDGAFGRRFDAAGTPLAVEFQVSVYTLNTQDDVTVALTGSGFVVAWRSGLQDGDASGIFARRFDTGGSPLATEFQVNTYTTGGQLQPSISTDDAGDFVVAWESAAGQDGGAYGVFGKRFNSAGVAQASEFQISTYTVGDQKLPAAAMDHDGSFVIAWSSALQDGSDDGIFARAFDSTGAPVATEFQVNAYTSGLQFAVDVDAESHAFVVAWDSNGQDGFYGGVFAQRFAKLAVLDIDGNGTVGALTDGLLVLRYMFGFTGVTLVSGALDLVNCTRCNSPTIEAYLSTLI